MRLFTAIELPEAVRAHLTRCQGELAPLVGEASPTKLANLHITLKFLGEVEDDRVPALCESLAHVRGASAELRFDRIECFPPRGLVRIVAAGASGGEKSLVALHAAIEQRCHYLGFEKEGRAYRPHVTLFRARRPLPGAIRDRAPEALGSLLPGPAFLVDAFVLMHSRLKPTGAEYAVAARLAL